MFEINDQHILVTGGSSGFGRHFARFLANSRIAVPVGGAELRQRRGGAAKTVAIGRGTLEPTSEAGRG